MRGISVILLFALLFYALGCRNYSSTFKVKKTRSVEQIVDYARTLDDNSEYQIVPKQRFNDETDESSLTEHSRPLVSVTHAQADKVKLVIRLMDKGKPSEPPQELSWKKEAFFEVDPDEEEPKKVSASIIGFIAVLVAILNIMVLMYIPFLGLAFGLLSIVFAIKALKIDDKKSKTLGVIALFISLFTLFISALATLLLVVGVSVFG